MDMAKNYYINARAVYHSQLPIERKQAILTGLLEQLEALNVKQPDNLSAHIKPLDKEERHILQEVYLEIQEALNELRGENNSE